MELQCQLLLYLDKRRFLIAMKNYCDSFLEQFTEKTICKFPPLRYLLEIDVMDLLDKFPDLGDFLIKEPIKFQVICSEIFFACLRSTNNDYNQNIERAQVNVTIRLKGVPPVLAQPNPCNYKGLVCFEGLLIALPKPLNYVYHSVWSCFEQCEGNEVILHYIPKSPPKCYVCKSVLFENSGLRRCGEQVIATLKIDTDLLSKSFIVTDDLISKLKLGYRYTIHAVLLKKMTVAWGLEYSLPLKAPKTIAIPRDVDELYRICDGVPWRFIYCLASNIGVNVAPLNCFMHLKMNLLLSLTSVKANTLTGSNFIHVLAAGYDSRCVGDLMIEASKLAERHLFLGTTNTTVSSTLIGSSRGVCVMPLPLHAYNQRQTSAILSAIESCEITTDTDKTKLQCAIWAQGMDFKKFVLLNVANVFGTICRGDNGDYSDELIDFMLQRAVEPADASTEEIQHLKDLALYIDSVAAIEVSLDNATESLLRSYFLVARKKKPHCISIGSMGALIATCVTSARLCRHTVATIDDAVFAIWLHITGSPEPRFAPTEYLETPSDEKRLPNIMNDFKEWLIKFINSNVF